MTSAPDPVAERVVRVVDVIEWGRERLLTADVLPRALSPGWSGAVDGDVPLPDRLRTG